MRRLEGKVALVTGASRGIGLEIATLFAAEGAKVVICARTVEEGKHPLFSGSLDSTLSKIRAGGGECTAVQGNVGDPDSCRAIVDAAHKAYGPIDVLVNNAAVEWPMASVKLSPKRWQTTFNICVHGPFYLAQMCLNEDMGPRKAGRIINISSASAIGPGPGPYGKHDWRHNDETCYGACKAAVERMSQGLAAEVSCEQYGLNVAVACYAPSQLVPTPGAVGNDRAPGAPTEPVETMARAALLLATEPVERVNGLVTYSQRLLRDFGWTVKHTGDAPGGVGIDASQPVSGFAAMESRLELARRQAKL
mmetsp:Transcript_94594/g.305396  ORF Transcript_94594/g.305396 Transcript_94594/m.305396 type:complete len:307 (-) Transcript_94594:65-985(-)